ncbi:MAG: non-homologous end joining protein Ku [Solirubrobacteraceae bacterium]
MPRSIWNGTITFGLVAVPVKVHAATEDKSIHFHQVHARDGAQIKLKRICTTEGKEVPYTEVANGYEVREGEYVLLSQEEIDAAAGERSRVIAIQEFVCAAEIDPVYYDHAYYLGTRQPAGAKPVAASSYRLLHDGLLKTGRAGVGRWVFHNREYQVAIRPLDDVLALHTMRFSEELVAGDELDVPKPGRAPTERELELAALLVDSLHGRFDPHGFEDTYRARVLELIRRKANGEQLALPEPERHQPPDDLIAALEASLRRDGSRSNRHSKRAGARS